MLGTIAGDGGAATISAIVLLLIDFTIVKPSSWVPEFRCSGQKLQIAALAAAA